MSGEKFVSALLASHRFRRRSGSETSIRPRLADTVDIPARRVMRNGYSAITTKSNSTAMTNLFSFAVLDLSQPLWKMVMQPYPS